MFKFSTFRKLKKLFVFMKVCLYIYVYTVISKYNKNIRHTIICVMGKEGMIWVEREYVQGSVQIR